MCRKFNLLYKMYVTLKLDDNDDNDNDWWWWVGAAV